MFSGITVVQRTAGTTSWPAFCQFHGVRLRDHIQVALSYDSRHRDSPCEDTREVEKAAVFLGAGLAARTQSACCVRCPCTVNSSARLPDLEAVAHILW